VRLPLPVPSLRLPTLLTQYSMDLYDFTTNGVMTVIDQPRAVVDANGNTTRLLLSEQQSVGFLEPPAIFKSTIH
jgi:hypothetical protein